MPSRFTNPSKPEYQLIGRKIIEYWEMHGKEVHCDVIAQQLNNQFEIHEILTVYSHLFPDMKLEKTFEEKVTDLPVIKEADIPVKKRESFKNLVLFEDEGPTLVRTKTGAII